MTAQMHPGWLDAGIPEDSRTLIKRMLAVSLALHLAGLAVVAGLRFTPRIERLQATQVTLVSLPPVQPAAPQPVEPEPQATQPEPPPPPKPAAPQPRASAPIAAKTPVLPSIKENMTMKAADSKLRDALRGIERPPEAPRLGEYQRPPMPVPPVPKVAESRPQEKHPSLSELAKQLEQVQRPQPKTAVASKPRPAARPVTKIQVTGDDSGLSRYLAIVQSRISEQWVAPPVDTAAKSYQVVIKFRLHKSGRISDVTVERESGNGYYDDAGKRAVLSVGQLQPFPAYVTEEVLETHFSFTVGEEAG
jgi:hypothetical protein